MRALRAIAAIILALIMAVLVVEVSFRLAGALARGEPGAIASSTRAHDVILCVGDSHTWGLGTGYPTRLSERLAESSSRYRVIHLGVPGSNTAQVRKRLPGYVERFQPILVVLWAGVNNKYNRSDSEGWRDAGVDAPSPLRTLLDSSRLLRFVRVWRNERELNRFLDGESTYVKPDDGGGGKKVGGTSVMRFRRSIMGETDIFDHFRGDYLPGAEVSRVTELDVRAIGEQLRAQRIPLLVVTYPADGGWFWEANVGIRAAAAALAIPVVESPPIFQRLRVDLIRRGEKAPKQLLLDRTAHPQQRLYDAIADAIFQVADENGFLDRIGPAHMAAPAR